MADLLVLNASEVRAALPMSQAIAGMKEAFTQLSAGMATIPLRSRIDSPKHSGVTLFMPALLDKTGDLAVKVVGVYPRNVEQGEPMIYATVLLLDADTGRPLALLEGSSLTAIRTGAGSGAATDLLARPEASVVAILGSGVQARTQLEAVCEVRPVTKARVYSPNADHARAFAAWAAGRGSIPEDARAVDRPAEAVREADIVCTATTSKSPVFDGRDLKPGAHVNAVGSFTPDMQEVDVITIERSLVVVDSRVAVLAEAGDLIVPLAAGLIDESHIYAEVGQIAAGFKPGRTVAEQITYFKSVGVAVQDAVAARIAYQNAVAQNLGTIVAL